MARIKQHGYFRDAHGDFGEIIANFQQALREKPIEFDSMVGRGLSGALVIPTLARAVGKTWAIVRKPQEGCHAWSLVQGEIGDRWLFVDDFISTGETLRATYDGVQKVATASMVAMPELVGAYTYQEGWNGSRHIIPPAEISSKYRRPHR